MVSTYLQLCIARLLYGISIGICNYNNLKQNIKKSIIIYIIIAMVLANALIVEITPVNIRGKTLFLMFNFFTIGELVTILVGYIFLEVSRQF
jgi:MFS family permease